MQSKRILVTGSNGQLGCEMRRLGAVSPNEYFFTDIAELDITDKAAVAAFVAEHGIEIIVNCAAYTDVDRAEEDEPTAERINSDAVRNLAEAMKAVDGTLFHISTDYVFGLDGNVPRTEDMPLDPLGAYGRTKLHGEQAIAASGCKHIIVRTAWLYSELTAERESLNVVFDQTGTPTYAGDLALALFSVIEGGTYEGNEGVYHFSNEGVCSWYDFAREIATATGRDCKIVPCHSSEFPSKVVRPPYSVLDKTKIKTTFGIEIPHWRDSMIYCLRRMFARG